MLVQMALRTKLTDERRTGVFEYRNCFIVLSNLRIAPDAVSRGARVMRNVATHYLHAPASTAVTALRKEADERIIIFSASTTRKKTRPPRKRRGQTQSGIASLSNKTCSGGA